MSNKLIVGPYKIFTKVPKDRTTIFFSGVIGNCPTEGKIVASSFNEETQQMFKNVENNLQLAGIEKQNILKTTVFLTDMGRFEEFNKLYIEFMGELRPSRSCVAVKELPKGGQVEMEFIAYE